MATVTVRNVPWDQLEHAYGAASDLPMLLEKVAKTRGRKLMEEMDELCSRVLHQGTIYSASPPVARWAIEMLDEGAQSHEAMYYDLLTGFADAARKAIRNGRAIPCHAGGDPVDGAAIQQAIFEARPRFLRDLKHGEAKIRIRAADLLLVSSAVEPDVIRVVLDRYFAEEDARVRYTFLKSLDRVRESVEDWSGFVQSALVREQNPENRFTLRCAEISQGTSSEEAIQELVATLVQLNASQDYCVHDEPFFEATGKLEPSRQPAVLLQAFSLSANPELLRVLAEHLLRLAFNDQRTGWGQTASSLLRPDGSPPPQLSVTRMALRSIGMLLLWRLFPFLRRPAFRGRRSKRKGIRKIDYWGLKGQAPPLPRKLNRLQREVLSTFAGKPELWIFRTNLWELFGLPAGAGDLRNWVAERS